MDKLLITFQCLMVAINAVVFGAMFIHESEMDTVDKKASRVVELYLLVNSLILLWGLFR